MDTKALMFPWLVEIGIVEWRDFHNNHRPAFPSELLATFVAFGAFTLVGAWNEKVGAALGWGLVTATLLNAFNPSSGTLKGLVGSSDSASAKVPANNNPNPYGRNGYLGAGNGGSQ